MKHSNFSFIYHSRSAKASDESSHRVDFDANFQQYAKRLHIRLYTLTDVIQAFFLEVPLKHVTAELLRFSSFTHDESPQQEASWKMVRHPPNYS